MAATANTVKLLRRIVLLAREEYVRAVECNRTLAGSASQSEINAAETAWREAQLRLEEVEPQEAMEGV